LEIIDIHPHAISRDVAKYPYSPLGGTMSVWSRERPVEGDALAVMMTEARIRRAVIVHASTAYGYDNSYVADVAAAHADQFRFVGALDVRAPDAPERLEYWVKERGMVGFRIFAAGATIEDSSGAWLADPQTFPAWEKARELGIAICLQTRHAALPTIEKMLERFPGVNVILDHFAYPPVEEGPPYPGLASFFGLAKHRNLYLKLTERNFFELRAGKATVPSFLDATIAAFGSDHIAWGSNFPQSEGTLVELRDLAVRELAYLPQADQQRIFSTTALTLYPSLTGA
jgi:predicted TIM-barrel fold metal-dependent hydrolase